MAPLAPRRPDEVARAAAVAASPDRRRAVFGGDAARGRRPADARAADQPGAARPARAATRARWCSARTSPRKGGVYGVTRGLQRTVGAGPGVRHAARRADDPRARRSARALSGLLPIPEIQYLAYLHNAEDQLRGEAATLPFFSGGRYRNPMVVRVAGYGYQKGFGGHFHNDNAVAVLRDVPGLVVASPSRPDDAAAMLRTCVARPDASTARSACSSSRSRCTTRATCTRTATGSGRRRTPARTGGRRGTCRSARRARTATVPTSPSSPSPTACR